MSELSGINVLITSGRRTLTQRWAKTLRQGGARVWIEAAEVPPDEQIDVIVTEGDSLDLQGPAQSSPTQWPAELAGVIRVGRSDATDDGTADAWLPQDATARELRLACRLLARISRLRCRQRSEAELRCRLAEEALSDPLTGLPNRRAWDQAIAQRLATAAESWRPGVKGFCLAIFDLDHFKRINDAHGHAVGDVVLRSAGGAIRDNLRDDDFVARLGGDEFGLLLSGLDESTATEVVERVRRALPSVCAVTASAGYCTVAAASGPLPSADALYSAADAAMHEAKRQGRDRTVGA